MLENLYENIGGKIKGLAKWTFIIEAIATVIAGIYLMATDDYLIVPGLLVIFVGPLVAWVFSWVLYAFGELVEDVHAIRNKEGTVAEEKSRREAEEKKAQTFSCPKCSNKIHYGDASCSSCGQRFDWSVLP